MPFFSICIPAYKNIAYLKRLLKSINEQTFTDFEVIITDDSSDSSVENLLQQLKFAHKVNYHKNIPALGMPANWNFALHLAKGEWIKIMHDDDWFALPTSLATFYRFALNQTGFLFSAYENVFEKDNKHVAVFLSKHWKKNILKQPAALYASNVIGPPSVTLIHKSALIDYDTKLTWRVDIDYYIRLINQHNIFTYIPKKLINVGLSEIQVTQSCFNKPEVELPESLYLLDKFGTHVLKNILVYDGFWRMFRNLKTFNIREVKKYTGTQSVPAIIVALLKDINTYNSAFLQIGAISKILMFVSYLKNKSLA